jgi:hypothetical protein
MGARNVAAGSAGGFRFVCVVILAGGGFAAGEDVQDTVFESGRDGGFVEGLRGGEAPEEVEGAEFFEFDIAFGAGGLGFGVAVDEDGFREEFDMEVLGGKACGGQGDGELAVAGCDGGCGDVKDFALCGEPVFEIVTGFASAKLKQGVRSLADVCESGGQVVLRVGGQAGVGRYNMNGNGWHTASNPL